MAEVTPEGPPAPSGGPPGLVMRGISKRFGATLALEDVDLIVQAGEVHALVGENGAGKSTLMKVLSGAIRPDAGSIELQGRPYSPRSPAEGRRAGVAMIYQELTLAPHLTVEENVALGAEPTRLGFVRHGVVRGLTAGALAELGHADIRPDVPVGSLTIGEQQLVEIARSLASGAAVIVFDEPTSSLSKKDAERLFGLIARLRARGIAIVYISHFIEEVKQVSDRFTVLRDGRVVGGGETAGATAQDIVRMMVGREIRELFPRSRRSAGDVVLQVRNLAGVSKPESASLALHRGEVLGIAGLVGAGRTELVRAIFGLDPVRRGEVKIAGYAGPASPAKSWLHGLGMLSENRRDEGLAFGLTIGDNLTLSKLEGFGPAGFVLPARQHAAAKRWIERLSIRCRGPGQGTGDLSGGNQQKVALARLLHHDADILLLDEPTRGIDVGSKAEVYRLIDELASGRESGRPARAVLMVSSYLPELLGVADRIAVMCRGRLGKARPVEELDEHALMLEATGAEVPACAAPPHADRSGAAPAGESR